MPGGAQMMCCCSTPTDCVDCSACPDCFRITGATFGVPCAQLNQTIQIYRSGCDYVGAVADVEFSITCNAANGTWDMLLDHAGGANYAMYTQPLAGNACPPLGAWTYDAGRSNCAAGTATLLAGVAAMPTEAQCIADCPFLFQLDVSGYCCADGNGTFILSYRGPGDPCAWSDDMFLWRLYHDATWWYLANNGDCEGEVVFRIAPVACNLCPPLGSGWTCVSVACPCAAPITMNLS